MNTVTAVDDQVQAVSEPPFRLPDPAYLDAAVVQMVSAPDLDHNLLRAEALIREAAQRGAQLVSLPEYFCLLGRRDTDKLALREAWGDGPVWLLPPRNRHNAPGYCR